MCCYYLLTCGTPSVPPYSVGRCPKDRGARLLLGGVPYAEHKKLGTTYGRPYNSIILRQRQTGSRDG